MKTKVEIQARITEVKKLHQQQTDFIKEAVSKNRPSIIVQLMLADLSRFGIELSALEWVLEDSENVSRGTMKPKRQKNGK